MKNFYSGQRIQGLTQNGNSVKGIIRSNKQGKFVLVENTKQYVPLEKLQECTPIGRLVEEEILDAINSVMQKIDAEKVAKSSKHDEVSKAIFDMTSAIVPESKNNEDKVMDTINKTIDIEAAKKNVEKGSSTDTAEAEKLVDEFKKEEDTADPTGIDNLPDVSSIGETTAKTDDSRLIEYFQRKHATINKKLEETYGEQLLNEEDFSPFVSSDAFFEKLNREKNAENDKLERVGPRTAKNWVDDSKGHGYAPEQYMKAYEEVWAMIEDGADEELVVEYLISNYEIQEAEAVDTYYDVKMDMNMDGGYAMDLADEQYDLSVDNEIESAIDSYEEQAPIYSDIQMFEHVCKHFDINENEGRVFLEEAKNSAPDAILLLAEAVKKQHRKNNLSKRLEIIKPHLWENYVARHFKDMTLREYNEILNQKKALDNIESKGDILS
jgi:hypothetical protein